MTFYIYLNAVLDFPTSLPSENFEKEEADTNRTDPIRESKFSDLRSESSDKPSKSGGEHSKPGDRSLVGKWVHQRWLELFQYNRDQLYAKQVACIIVFYYACTLEFHMDTSKFAILENSRFPTRLTSTHFECLSDASLRNPENFENSAPPSKFEVIRQWKNNRFTDNMVHHHILDLFRRAQRTYYAFSRVARIFRLRHTPVRINTDLYMSELSPTARTTFALLDTRHIYYFTLKDLARIITESLTYSYSFFSEPTICKNPYNNVPFTKSTLYNIYFQMKSVFCVVPKFVQWFFDADFNVYEFKKRHEWDIREYKIQEYIDHTAPALMTHDILRMFRKYDTRERMSIDKDIPCDVLVNRVKPLYRLYLLYKYSICSAQRENYEHELEYKIGEFIRRNPAFGRKQHVAGERHSMFTPRTGVQPVHFCSTVVHEPDPDSLSRFMTTHQYNDALYIRFTQYGSFIEPHLSDDESDETEETFELTPRPMTTPTTYFEMNYDTEEDAEDAEDAEDTEDTEEEVIVDDIFHDIDSEQESDTESERDD